jgi:hypothetical protein
MTIYLLASAWHEIGANIASIISALAIIFVIIEYNANRNVRNIQLMHRCIDQFREWNKDDKGEVNFNYLELLNEELFYFQKRLIQKKVAIEWIEGMLDYITVYSKNDEALNSYGKQVSVQSLQIWNEKKYFFNRVNFFVKTDFGSLYKIPDFDNSRHSEKKSILARQLYEWIKKYKY